MRGTSMYELVGKEAFLVSGKKILNGKIVKEVREHKSPDGYNSIIHSTYYLKLWSNGEEVSFERKDIDKKVFLSYKDAEVIILSEKLKDINSIGLHFNGEEWVVHIPEICIYRDSPEEALAAMREYIDKKWSKT